MGTGSVFRGACCGFRSIPGLWCHSQGCLDTPHGFMTPPELQVHCAEATHIMCGHGSCAPQSPCVTCPASPALSPWLCRAVCVSAAVEAHVTLPWGLAGRGGAGLWGRCHSSCSELLQCWQCLQVLWGFRNRQTGESTLWALSLPGGRLFWDGAMSGRCWFLSCSGAGLAQGSVKMSRAVLGGGWAALQGASCLCLFCHSEGTALEVTE